MIAMILRVQKIEQEGGRAAKANVLEGVGVTLEGGGEWSCRRCGGLVERMSRMGIPRRLDRKQERFGRPSPESLGKCRDI